MAGNIYHFDKKKSMMDVKKTFTYIMMEENLWNSKIIGALQEKNRR